MKMSLLVLLFGMISGCSTVDKSAKVQSNPDTCSGGDIRSVHVPKFDKAQSLFEYKYQLLDGTDPHLPVVIVLQGGPGNLGIGESAETFYPQINIDLRGIGCNKVDKVEDPEQFYSTETFADDVVAVIEANQLTDYAIFGTSFGTALGTVAAHKLEKKNLSKPFAMIFQGTVGKHFGDSDLRQPYVNEWQRFRPELSNFVLDALKGDAPLGISNEKWGEFLAGTLLLAYNTKMNDQGGFELTHTTKQVLEGAFGPNPEQMIGIIEHGLLGFDEAQATLYRYVLCREFSPGGYELDFTKRGLDLVETTKDYCGGKEMIKGFDVKNYPYSVPTYYFSGKLDAGTPEWQVDYHVSQNSGSVRHKISIPFAGHNSLAKNLKDCKKTLFRDILLNRTATTPDNFVEHLGNCNLGKVPGGAISYTMTEANQ